MSGPRSHIMYFNISAKMMFLSGCKMFPTHICGRVSKKWISIIVRSFSGKLIKYFTSLFLSRRNGKGHFLCEKTHKESFGVAEHAKQWEWETRARKLCRDWGYIPRLAACPTTRLLFFFRFCEELDLITYMNQQLLIPRNKINHSDLACIYYSHKWMFIVTLHKCGKNFEFLTTK
jgi:hypothetical protein